MNHEFKPGDRVRNHHGGLGVILAVDGDDCWVKLDGIGRGTWGAIDLTLVPPPPQPAPDAIDAAIADAIEMAIAGIRGEIGMTSTRSPGRLFADLLVQIIDRRIAAALEPAEFWARHADAWAAGGSLGLAEQCRSRAVHIRAKRTEADRA